MSVATQQFKPNGAISFSQVQRRAFAPSYDSPVKEQQQQSCGSQSMLMFSADKQLELKYKSGVAHLRKFFPRSTDQQLRDALHQCDLDSHKALEHLSEESYNDQKQEIQHQVSQLTGNPSPSKLGQAPMQKSVQSMASFQNQQPKRSKRSRAQASISQLSNSMNSLNIQQSASKSQPLTQVGMRAQTAGSLSQNLPLMQQPMKATASSEANNYVESKNEASQNKGVLTEFVASQLLDSLKSISQEAGQSCEAEAKQMITRALSYYQEQSAQTKPGVQQKTSSVDAKNDQKAAARLQHDNEILKRGVRGYQKCIDSLSRKFEDDQNVKAALEQQLKDADVRFQQMEKMQKDFEQLKSLTLNYAHENRKLKDIIHQAMGGSERVPDSWVNKNMMNQFGGAGGSGVC